MGDIRLLVSRYPNSVYTREGHKVEIVTTSAGCHNNLIYGYVHKNGKRIGHYWQSDGSFGDNHHSHISLEIKTE